MNWVVCGRGLLRGCNSSSGGRGGGRQRRSRHKYQHLFQLMIKHVVACPTIRVVLPIHYFRPPATSHPTTHHSKGLSPHYASSSKFSLHCLLHPRTSRLTTICCVVCFPSKCTFSRKQSLDDMAATFVGDKHVAINKVGRWCACLFSYRVPACLP